MDWVWDEGWRVEGWRVVVRWEVVGGLGGLIKLLNVVGFGGWLNSNLK